MSSPPLVSVVFVDCCPEVLAAVARGLDASHGIEVLGLLGTVTHVLDVCRTVQPNIIVLDPTMPDLDATAVVRTLATLCPRSRVLIHAVSISMAEFDAVVEAGAWGVTYRGWDVETLARAIHSVHRGEFVLNLALRQAAVGETAAAPERPAVRRDAAPHPLERATARPTRAEAARVSAGGRMRLRAQRTASRSA